MCFKNVLTALVVVSLALTATVAQADAITILNAGFEDSGTPPVNWGGYGNVSPWAIPAHSGDQYGMISCGSDVQRLFQQLTTDGSTPYKFAAAGDTLTIDFWTEKNPWEGAYGTELFYAQLWAQDAAPLGGGAAGYIHQATGLGPTNNTWTQKSFTYTATAADVGKTLWLQFDHYAGGSGNYAAVLLDDVSGSYTAIPEPGTLALLVTGLAGLLCYAWRKQK